ncbi:MAG TPA: 1-acyl-sn-glycerol-3-phosphate acyltransferase, partial [Vulgatibacter sp.]
GILHLPGAPAATHVDEFGRDSRFEEQVRPLLEWIYRRWFRVEATGFEALPRGVPLVLVANRAGALPWDSVILALAARNAGLEVRPLVEDSVFHFPSMGLFVNRLGAVRACPENAERILGSGGAIAVFPEGATGFGKPFRERYRLQRFGRGGFLKLALRMEALVVPVSIVGSEEIYPLLGKVGLRPFGFPFLPITPTFPWLGAAGLLPLPARWHIDAGDPFDFRGYGTAAAQAEPLVMRLAEEVRGTVQTMLDARLGQRRSVFR